MKNKSKLSGIVFYVSLLAFIVFAGYVVYINQEVFYTAHDRSEFIFGAPFFQSLMAKPFGLMRYVGAWLTMLFSRPAVGTGVLAAVWVLIYLVGVRAFRLQGSAAALMLLPVACLLVSVVDLGYWIYTTTIRGYWFSQSVGYLVMLLLLWVARSTPRKWHPVWYLAGFCIYPLLGWFALLFVLCLSLSEKPTWRELLALFVLIFTAGIWHTQFYSNLKYDDVVMAGFPRFETPSDSTPSLSIPFWVLGAVTVFMACLQFTVYGLQMITSKVGRPAEKSTVNCQPSTVNCQPSTVNNIIPVLCAVAGIWFTCSFMYYDRNYIDEMRMVRVACDDDWKEVLRMAEENKRPTNTMVFLKNIALMNEGGLLDRAFKLGNDAASINNPDSLHVTLLDIASPLVYYNYGLLNEATRLNFEMAIQDGFSPFYLKMLARCALASGDQKLVERYTTLLHHLPFYGSWLPAPVTDKVKALQACYPDALTGVENSDSYLVNEASLWYGSDSKVASEQALFYAMVRCDSRRFWASLRNYVRLHMNEEFPLHAMEAYILYMDKAPEEKRMMLPVEQSVYDRYKRFWAALESKARPGMTIEQAGVELRDEYGDTYWWYNIFGRKPINVTGKIGSEIPS